MQIISHKLKVKVEIPLEIKFLRTLERLNSSEIVFKIKNN